VDILLEIKTSEMQLQGNLGALAGKMIDANGFYNNGPAQNILGLGMMLLR